MDIPTPQQQHEWLSRLVGKWSFETECSMGPDQPPAKHLGTEVVRSLGGLWMVAEMEGDMPGGGKSQSIMTLGYDPQQDRFIGTFIASVMTHLWVYNGSLDSTGTILTLDTEGPDWESGGMTKYQDIITQVSGEERTLTSRHLGQDGQWRQFMVAHYRRQK